MPINGRHKTTSLRDDLKKEGAFDKHSLKLFQNAIDKHYNKSSGFDKNGFNLDLSHWNIDSLLKKEVTKSPLELRVEELENKIKNIEESKVSKSQSNEVFF